MLLSLQYVTPHTTYYKETQIKITEQIYKGNIVYLYYNSYNVPKILLCNWLKLDIHSGILGVLVNKIQDISYHINKTTHISFIMNKATRKEIFLVPTLEHQSMSFLLEDSNVTYGYLDLFISRCVDSVTFKFSGQIDSNFAEITWTLENSEEMKIILDELNKDCQHNSIEYEEIEKNF